MNNHIMESSKGSAGAQTIRRAIRALKLIAAHPAPGIRLVDFAAQMELERPTAHRVLKALVAEGMLTQHAKSRRYSLGSLVFELGIAAAHQFNLYDICQPVLTALAEQTGDTSFLFVRSGTDAICIARVQGTYPIQTPAVPVGSRQPLGVNAGGLALLSALPRNEVEEILDTIAPRLSVYGNLDTEQLFDLWMRARQAGYALIGNRAVPGVTAMGLPVMSETGLPIAAITIAAIHSRMAETRTIEIFPLLKNAAQEMARLLRQ
jgi:DNA-binding IclR family transcriptional regulator